MCRSEYVHPPAELPFVLDVGDLRLLFGLARFDVLQHLPEGSVQGGLHDAVVLVDHLAEPIDLHEAMFTKPLQHRLDHRLNVRFHHVEDFEDAVLPYQLGFHFLNYFEDVPLDVDALLVNVDVFPEKRLREIVDEPVMGVVLLDRLGTVLTSGLAVHEVDDRVPE